MTNTRVTGVTYGADVGNPATVHPALVHWGAHMTACGLTVATVRVRSAAVSAICRAEDVDPLTLAQRNVSHYLATHDLKPWSRKKYLEHVAAFGRWLGRDLIGDLRPPKAPPGVPRPVTEGQLALLLAGSTGRVRAWVLLGAYLGLRSFETAKVAVEDLHDGPTGRQLRVQGKGGRVDELPVPPVVALELARWVNAVSRGRLWPDVDAATVQRAIRRLGVTVGVDVTSHQLRHRYGTQLFLASGGNLLLTQRLMRHASPATTAIYVQLADSAATRLALALPGAQSA